MERVNLQEGWRFAKANSNEWTPVSVPGTVLSGLLEAGKMQDPYYRENEYEARELLAKDYVFETDFCISEEQLNKKRFWSSSMRNWCSTGWIPWPISG